MAGNGTNFLIATVTSPIRGDAQHGVMLVDADGRPLLPASYVYSGTGTVDGVAWNGHEFLFVFGGLGATSAVRFSAEGKPLDAAPFTILPQSIYPLFPNDITGVRRVAWDGTQWVVLTSSENLLGPNGNVVSFETATRIGADGTIQQNHLTVTDSANADLASRNGISVIAYGNVYVRTMNVAGGLSDPAQISTDSSLGNAVAAGDDGFLVVWPQNGTRAIHARHLDPAGRPDAPQFTIGSSSDFSPAVTWDGTSYRVAWTDAANVIQSVHVNATGVIDTPVTHGSGTAVAIAQGLDVWEGLDRVTRAGSGDGHVVHRFYNWQTLDSVAFTPDGFTIAWNEITPNVTPVDSQLTNVNSGTTAEPIRDGRYTLIRGLDRPLIVSGASAPFTFRYADGLGAPFTLPTRTPIWTGSAFLAVWTASLDPSIQQPLYAQRFDANGTPIDAAPRVIGTSNSLSANYQGAAALYNGVFAGASNSKVLIAYVDPGASLRGVLLSGDQFIDIGEIAEPQALANPIVVTSDGQDFIVTWVSGMRGTSSFIASRLVLANGSMPDPWRIDSSGGDTKDSLATFWTGENYLVVWSKVVSGGHELWGLRLRPDGTLIDFPPQKIGTISGEAPQWSYRNRILAIAWRRDLRLYYAFAGLPRRRAAASR